MKLHTKTTLLVSAITIAVLAVMMFVITSRVTDLVRDEQQDLAELQARSLAEHVTTSAEPFDLEHLQRSTQLVQGTRPFIVSVRLWELSSGRFALRVASSDELPPQTMDEATKNALLQKKTYDFTSPVTGDHDSVYFHAYAPYYKRGQVAGAVEIVERLDDIPDLAKLYSQSATLIALVAVLLLMVATYILFRYLIYRPMKRLLYAMARAKAGSLKAQAPVLARDEFGRLSEGFNRMIARISEMTREREAQKEILRQRVLEATAELQHRNHQLAEANLQLWDVSRKLGDMERLAAAGQTAAQFAHEVGTPLNLISCHVELLHDEMQTNPQSAESRTKIIGEQIERIERIVRQMLDRTRLEKAVLAPVDLNRILHDIADATLPRLDSHNVKLTLSLKEPLPPIAGSPDYLQQVFINLINNALDAMPEGGELAIRTFVDPNGEKVTVEVADNGCGMSEEVRARIFDPLYTTKENGLGTGLGLVIVNQLMREHDGQIEVESFPGQGAKFVLHFPAIQTLSVAAAKAEAA
ncbi:MAG: HAMP domain-containing protein [Acidobacteria bacterium]|nr:HAMP domain-containing protein [Acidobacteriota bacterium]